MVYKNALNFSSTGRQRWSITRPATQPPLGGSRNRIVGRALR